MNIDAFYATALLIARERLHASATPQEPDGSLSPHVVVWDLLADIRQALTVDQYAAVMAACGGAQAFCLALGRDLLPR